MTMDLDKALAILDRITDRTAAAIADVRNQLELLSSVVLKLDEAEDDEVDTAFLLHLVYELEDAFDVLEDKIAGQSA